MENFGHCEAQSAVAISTKCHPERLKGTEGSQKTNQLPRKP